VTTSERRQAGPRCRRTADRCSRGGSGFRLLRPGRRAPATPNPSRRHRFDVAGESFPGQRRRQPSERSHRRRDREQAGSAAGAEAVVVCRDRGGTPRLHRTHHAGPRFGVAGESFPGRTERNSLPLVPPIPEPRLRRLAPRSRRPGQNAPATPNRLKATSIRRRASRKRPAIPPSACGSCSVILRSRFGYPSVMARFLAFFTSEEPSFDRTITEG
jgi:hypothetical protein